MMKIRNYFTISLFGLFCSFTGIVSIDHIFSSKIKILLPISTRHFKHSKLEMHRYEDRETK